MKNILYILLFISASGRSQSLTSKEIAKYIKTVDSLRYRKVLTKVEYPNMSSCGGALTGYYYNNTLVYIKSVYQGELGYTEQKFYLKDTVPYKLHYREYSAEWGKYYQKYPNKELDLDESKMTYSDTVYHITFSNPVKIAKTSKNKYVNNKIEKDLLSQIRYCVKVMFAELESEKKSYKAH